VASSGARLESTRLLRGAACVMVKVKVKIEDVGWHVPSRIGIMLLARMLSVGRGFSCQVARIVSGEACPQLHLDEGGKGLVRSSFGVVSKQTILL